MNRLGNSDIVDNARRARTVVPAFNIPYLPMMQGVVDALRDTGTFGFIQVARPEWEKFEAGSLCAIREEYETCRNDRYTRLHLDHVPVVDEDGLRVDFEAIVGEAISLGYESVMVDGSRLPFAENVACTSRVVAMAADAGVPVEAELGAVLGHEAGPLPPYEELFSSGRGFTRPEDAGRFISETGADWLSVAIGNIHGAISEAGRSRQKVRARLDIEHLDRIAAQTNVPLVLHGGSGIKKECLLRAFRHGIAKINIGTTIRHAYEQGRRESTASGRKRVYDSVVALCVQELEIAGSAEALNLGTSQPGAV